MKVKAQNQTKQNFFSRLHKHVKSPGLSKLLRKRKRRKKSTVKEKPQPIMPADMSNGQSFHVKVLKRAGQTMHDSLPNFWSKDLIAEKKKSLVECAQKNNIIVASEIVSKNVETSSSDEDSEEECDTVGGSTKSSQDSADTDLTSSQCSLPKDFYLHFSSTDSSVPGSPHKNAEKRLNLLLSKDEHRRVLTTDTHDTTAENVSTPTKEKLPKSHTDAGVQAEMHDLLIPINSDNPAHRLVIKLVKMRSVNEMIEYLRKHAEECKFSSDNNSHYNTRKGHASEHFDKQTISTSIENGNSKQHTTLPMSNSTVIAADKMLQKLADHFKKQPSGARGSDTVGSYCLDGKETPQVQGTTRQRSTSAGMTYSPYLLSDAASKERTVSSDNTSQFRSYLLTEHRDFKDASCATSSRHTRHRLAPCDRKFICDSDSESDDSDTLKRLKWINELQQQKMKNFFPCENLYDRCQTRNEKYVTSHCVDFDSP